MDGIISDYLTVDESFLARLQVRNGKKEVAIARRQQAEVVFYEGQEGFEYIEEEPLNLQHDAMRGSPGSVIGEKLTIQATDYHVVAIVPYIDVFIPEESNALLFVLDDGKYMHVGSFVAKFKPLNPIMEYESSSRNECTYAYAVDYEGNIYLMTKSDHLGQGVIFQINEDLIEEVDKDDQELLVEDPYLYYYKFHKKYPDQFGSFAFETVVED